MDVLQPYWDEIRSGRKRVEGRMMTDKWLQLRIGDTLHIRNGSTFFLADIVGINYYPPYSSEDVLGTFLQHETLQRVLPGINSIQEGKEVYYNFWNPRIIQSTGMMGIVLSV